MSKRNIRLGTLYRSELLKSLSLPVADKLLDIGCLDGHILNLLQGNVKLGVDVDPIPNPQVNQVQADGCNLPFQNDYFDFILAMDVIEHVVNDQDFISSIYRVLKPGGKVFLSTPSRFIQINPAFMTNYVNRKWGHTIRPGYTPAELGSLFHNCKIDLNIRYFSARNYRRWYLIARALYYVSPVIVSKWIRWMAKEDSNLPQDEKGFIFIEGIKQ